MKSKEAIENIRNGKFITCKICSNNYNQWLTGCMCCRNELSKSKELDIIEKDLDRLEQYKSIEKELGIDLITLFKALKNGVWTNQEQTYGDAKQGKIRFFKVRLLLEEKSIGCIHNSMWKGEEVIKRLYLKNYGKTWALTKEELENELEKLKK